MTLKEAYDKGFRNCWNEWMYEYDPDQDLIGLAGYDPPKEEQLESNLLCPICFGYGGDHMGKDFKITFKVLDPLNDKE